MLIFTGRTLGVVPRDGAPEGYMDLDHDDYKDGDTFKEWQEIVLETALRLVVSNLLLVFLQQEKLTRFS